MKTPETEKVEIEFIAPQTLFSAGISEAQVKELLDIWKFIGKFAKSQPELEKNRSRTEKYVYRWKTQFRWIEFKIVVGDYRILELHLCGMSYSRLSFRSYINQVSEADVKSAFAWLYNPTIL